MLLEGRKALITVYTLEQSKLWDEIVHSFQSYDTYWLSGYVKAFFLHGDGEPLLIFYKGSDTRGINVVMKHDVADAACFRGVLPKEV